jgi:hypothetical protein
MIELNSRVDEPFTISNHVLRDSIEMVMLTRASLGKVSVRFKFAGSNSLTSVLFTR